MIFTILFLWFSLVLVSSDKKHQSLKKVFDHISKHVEVRRKYSSARRIFNSILGVWKSLGPNTVFRLSNFSNQSDSYFQIHCQNLNQLKINCSKFIKFQTTGERIRLHSYGFQNTPDRPTRSYPLKVRMGGNSDDSSTREPSKVVIIKLL